MVDVFSVGDVVDGKYRIIRVIGEGGWGIVFEGENVRTLMRVAIKALRPQANLTAETVSRFEREAQAAGRIGSEHIVEVFDLGLLADGTHYLVMELLFGQNLGQRLEAVKRLDPIVAVKLMIQLLDGLGAAHGAGILHRDLKPENLFLVPTRSSEEFVKILDFGISKFMVGPLASSTVTGAVLGSPSYMAPEQARGLKHIDQRTDLYSVGAVLFECVTGSPPFDGDNFNDLMFNIVMAPRPSPRDLRPDLDEGLASIILRSIAADPGQRFTSAAEFAESLIHWLETQGVSAVLPPELHRWLKPTPNGDQRLNLASSGAPPLDTHRSTPSRDQDQTVETSTDVGTPLASSSSKPGSTGSRRRRAAFVGGFALLAVVVSGVLIGKGRGYSGESSMGSVNILASPPTEATDHGARDPVTPKPSRDTSTALHPHSQLIELTIKATPSSAKLFLDNVPLTGNPSIGQFQRDGEPHLVRAEAAHYITQTATVAFDDRSHVVEVTLEKVPPPPPPRPPPPPPPPPPPAPAPPTGIR